MRIKRVEADNVTEAMRELRRELGDHALILHTKCLPARGLAGWFKTPRVEILGAVDEPEIFGATAAARAAAAPAAQPATVASPLAAAPTVETRPAPASLALAPEAPAAAETPRGRKGRKAAARGATVEPQRQLVAERLARFRAANPAIPIARETAPAPAAAGPGPEVAPAAPALDGIRLAASDFSRAGRRARRVAFVGPTGAGKTTTLAKLAARAQLEHGRRVGLVTIDTYRIGAVPQLRAYADILGVPLEVASTPDELSHALARLADRDVVFVDTIGRSPMGGGVDALVPFMAVAGADEVHLVIAATTRMQDSLRAARSFARLVPDRLVVTKLDETDDREAVTALASATSLPLAWLGTGQEVPDDIEEPTAARIAALAGEGCRA